MGNGHRNMYKLTGQPGWMRLGYSPGWAGAGGELEFLKAQASRMEETLAQISERISKLESEGE